ncbi:helix-turn-helix domain-containing protein [Stutzerimonas degradans]|uniref:helix-turn-helix domain-containing protein n=1 Tax=Stutzerimonas degradans TaxID=2968968 RepID=UPI0012D9AD70|nr:helix-turn-helix transcriptional regulator [Stutzerimonas degradans]
MKICATDDAVGKSVGERLREERTRIGLNQDDFAKLGGVNRNTQGSYEKNDRSPDASYLANVASAGVDVLYVLTGQRAAPSEADLSDDESELLNHYRSMPDQDRAAMRRLGSALAVSAGRYTTRKDSDS